MLVECGNGGDWEFERDRFLWELWIKQNMRLIDFSVVCTERCDAFHAEIIFGNVDDEIVFKLKAPSYITYKDVGL